jgi:hypothetical protein
LINNCRKIVLRGAGTHVGAIHERESPLMSAPHAVFLCAASNFAYAW